MTVTETGTKIENPDKPTPSPRADTTAARRRQTGNGHLFRHPDAVLPASLAVVYATAGYGLGLVLLTQNGLGFAGGVLLLAHSRVIAAFLLHDCVHGSLFAPPGTGSDPHRLLGVILAWLSGACYGTFEAIRDKHLRHHFERADIVALDYRNILARHKVARWLVQAGQWLCLPAVELLMHLLVLVRPFGRGGDRRARRRILLVGGIRLGLLGLSGWLLGWQLPAGYAVSHLLFLSVMGFMDAFQHRYLLLEGLEKARRESPARDRVRFPGDYFSRDYEESHTFSNLLSERWPVLNLLVLNFCYHNVHHRYPTEPWYGLPALHRSLYGEARPNPRVIPLRRQIRDFFRYRVARVMAPVDDGLAENTAVGAAGVSFLTPV